MRGARPQEVPAHQAQGAFVTKSLLNKDFSHEAVCGGSGFMPEVFAFT